MTARLWNLIPEAWQPILLSCRTEIDQIDGLLKNCEQSGQVVAPKLEKIFSSLTVAPSDVSVVILGQDPYPTEGCATGLAFAVPLATTPLPASLRNIFKEVLTDTGCVSTADSTLSAWSNQGVLLLNTSLTTQVGIRAAHSSWPWNAIIQTLLTHVVVENPNAVAILWGAHARQFSPLFEPSSIVISAHPSPLSASRGFLGSKPFTKTNQILSTNRKPSIIW